jgi:hypothetical protein
VKNIAMIQRTQFGFRLSALIYAGVLAIQALWLLSTELLHPKLPYFPADKAASERAAGQRFVAQLAAEIGGIRGDLWADYAITLFSELLTDAKNAAAGNAKELTEDTRNVAITAAKLAPTDSRMWLLLALIDQRLDWLGRGIPGPLKMSYYTGPNAAALIPTRVLVATRTAAITDPELQSLVSREIRTIVTRRPDLRPALFVAYRDALPEGRRFIEATVGDLDRNLLASIRGSVSLPDNVQGPRSSTQQGSAQQRAPTGTQTPPQGIQRP